MTATSGAIRRLAMCGLLCLLTVCGGSAWAVGNPGFLITPDSVRLKAKEGELAQQQYISVRDIGTQVGAIGAAYLEGTTPAAWLSVDYSYATQQFVFRTTSAAQSLAVGTYKTQIALGSVGLDLKTILGYYIVPVTLSVVEPYVATTLSGPALSFVHTIGAPVTAGLGMTVTAPAGRTWEVSASQPWLQSTPSAGTGNGQFVVRTAPAGLAVGDHQGVLRLVSDGRTLERPAILKVRAPQLQIGSTSLVFGGATGRSFGPQQVSFSINTGANAHAWSVSGLPAWLQATAMSGTVSGTPATLTLRPDRLAAAPGTQKSSFTLTINVDGYILTRTIAVTFKLDEHRLRLSRNGVAFAKLPGWSRLNRTLQVSDNLGAGTPWTASSDRTWLQVTPSGNPGTPLVLQANADGLAFDRLYTATVTVTPVTPGARPDTVRVGLWVGSATPDSVRVVAGRNWRQAQPDPIRPYVYVHDGGTDIFIYNVYTGLEVGRLANVAPSLGTMTISGDGLALFVVDTTLGRIVPVNLQTRVAAASFALQPGGLAATETILQYGRVNGVGVLVGGSDAYVVQGTQRVRTIAAGMPGAVHAFSADGRTLAVINGGISPYSLIRSSVDYSAADGGSWFATQVTSAPFGTGSNGRDVAVTATGTRIYAAAGAPYEFTLFDGSTAARLGALPGDAYPTSVKVASDGRVFAAADVWYGPTDLWVYRVDGTPAYSGRAAGYARSVLSRQFWPSGDALMGIALTDDPVMVLVPVGP